MILADPQIIRQKSAIPGLVRPRHNTVGGQVYVQMSDKGNEPFETLCPKIARTRWLGQRKACQGRLY